MPRLSNYSHSFNLKLSDPSGEDYGIDLPISMLINYLDIDGHLSKSFYFAKILSAQRLRILFNFGDSLKSLTSLFGCRINLGSFDSKEIELPDVFIPILLWSMCFKGDRSNNNDNDAERDTNVKSSMSFVQKLCANFVDESVENASVLLSSQHNDGSLDIEIDAAVIYKMSMLFCELMKRFDELYKSYNSKNYHESKESFDFFMEEAMKMLHDTVVEILRQDMIDTLGGDFTEKFKGFDSSDDFIKFLRNTLFSNESSFSSWHKFGIRDLQQKFHKLYCILNLLNKKEYKNKRNIKKPVADIISHKRYLNYSVNALTITTVLFAITAITAVLTTTFLIGPIAIFCYLILLLFMQMRSTLLQNSRLMLLDNLVSVFIGPILLVSMFVCPAYVFIPFAIACLCFVGYLASFNPLSRLLSSFKRWFYAKSGRSMVSSYYGFDGNMTSYDNTSLQDFWNVAENKAECVLSDQFMPFVSWSKHKAYIADCSLKSTMSLVFKLLDCYSSVSADFAHDIKRLSMTVKSFVDILDLKSVDIDFHRTASYLMSLSQIRSLHSKESMLKKRELLCRLNIFQFASIVQSVCSANGSEELSDYLHYDSFSAPSSEKLVFGMSDSSIDLLIDKLCLTCDYALLGLLTSKSQSFVSAMQAAGREFSSGPLDDLYNRVLHRIFKDSDFDSSDFMEQVCQNIKSSIFFLDNVKISGNIEVSLGFLEKLSRFVCYMKNKTIEEVGYGYEIFISSLNKDEKFAFSSLCSPVNNPNYAMMTKYIRKYNTAMGLCRNSLNSPAALSRDLMTRLSPEEYLGIMFAAVSCTVDALKEHVMFRELSNKYPFIQYMCDIVNIDKLVDMYAVHKDDKLSLDELVELGVANAKCSIKEMVLDPLVEIAAHDRS
ncbi:hypothetical protein CAXC1_110002 [Candidatus Xenohaliotis californiensis]|uniref:Uncharacterized protein n=1 Tax=Candidatus Xenohaliotis californiensis TaxID=84677 RepID=A0ABP0ERH8_9RICK|nr:hypothetical protein CAXC1_110002 [Candidatus Xenohaliotis californiensis]